MSKLHIGQKVLLVVVIIFVVFAIGLSYLVGNTSFQNLNAVKQAELARMSQILADQIVRMGEKGISSVRAFEENRQIATEVTLLNKLGPYYSSPDSNAATDFENEGAPIEPANQIDSFETQLKLISLLQPIQRLNNLASVSLYLVSPFDLVEPAQPALALRLGNNTILVSQFKNKGNVKSRAFYQIDTHKFVPPPTGYFDSGTTNLASPQQLYTENNFSPVSTNVIVDDYFPQDWQNLTEPRLNIIDRNGIPVIQTWYPIKLPITNPETRAEETQPVGIAVAEQYLDTTALNAIKGQLGLDVGLAENNKLKVSTLTAPNQDNLLTDPSLSSLNFDEGEFYYADKAINFANSPDSSLQALVFSPVAELIGLTGQLSLQIALVALGAIIIVGIIIYMSIQYLINRPLGNLLQGVKALSTGNLTQTVKVDSQDELGELGVAFNGMAGQLADLISSLEDQVHQRTAELALSMEVGQRASAIKDLDVLLPTITELIRQRFDLYYTQVYFVDDSGKNLVLRTGTGSAGQELLARHHTLPIDEEAIISRVVAEGKAIVVPDTEQSDLHKANPLLPETRSELAVPLRVQDRIIGVLDMQASRVNTFTERNVTVFEAMATQLALTVDSAQQWRLTQEAQQKAQEALQLLTRESWGQKLASTRDTLGFAYDLSAITPLKTGADNQGVAVPVMVQNEPIGQLIIEMPGQKDLTTDEHALMTAVAQQLAQKAENLRLFGQTQQRAAREQLAREISDKIRASRNIETALKTAAAELSQALGATKAVVTLQMEASDEPEK